MSRWRAEAVIKWLLPTSPFQCHKRWKYKSHTSTRRSAMLWQNCAAAWMPATWYVCYILWCCHKIPENCYNDRQISHFDEQKMVNTTTHWFHSVDGYLSIPMKWHTISTLIIIIFAHTHVKSFVNSILVKYLLFQLFVHFPTNFVCFFYHLNKFANFFRIVNFFQYFSIALRMTLANR